MKFTDEQLRSALFDDNISIPRAEWKLANGRTTCTMELTIGNEVFELKGMSEYDARRMHMAGRVTPGISAMITGEAMVVA